MLNNTMIIGNLGTDPELRYTPAGVPVCNFNVAVNESWTGQDGQKQEETTWFRVTAWRGQAESAAEYLTKGRQVHIEGKMRASEPWQDNEGNYRNTLELTARRVTFLGGNSEPAPAQAGGSTPTPPAGNSAAPAATEPESEDVPF